ncbi:unnamed protein product [Rhodiola kirilowii]
MSPSPSAGWRLLSSSAARGCGVGCAVGCRDGASWQFINREVTAGMHVALGKLMKKHG